MKHTAHCIYNIRLDWLFVVYLIYMLEVGIIIVVSTVFFSEWCEYFFVDCGNTIYHYDVIQS